MLNGFVEHFRRLLGRAAPGTAPAAPPERAEADYRRVDEVNFTCIFANRLANLAVSDATLSVSGRGGAARGARAELVACALEDVFSRAHRITTQVLGTGGRVLVPYVAGDEVRCDVVSQDRMFVTGAEGGRVTRAVILADAAQEGGRTYFRWADYALEDGVQRVRRRITDAQGRPVPPELVPAWADVPEEVAIAGVRRLTLAHLRCPVDDRREQDVYGVPITYGCEALIDEIHEHMRVIRREYRLTRPMLGLSAEMWRAPFSGEGEAGIERARRSVQDADEPFIPVEAGFGEAGAPWMIYAPDIRSQAMHERLEHLFDLLERAVGTSRGILTARETTAATATEIRAANRDTFALVGAVRRMWERGIAELAEAVDVLCEHYALSPTGQRGAYCARVEWDMSLLESSEETFHQLAELESRGALSKAELRRWVLGGTLEEAERATRPREA